MGLYCSLPREGCPWYQGFKGDQARVVWGRNCESQGHQVPQAQGRDYVKTLPVNSGAKSSLPGLENNRYRDHACQAKEVNSCPIGTSQQP